MSDEEQEWGREEEEEPQEEEEEEPETPKPVFKPKPAAPPPKPAGPTEAQLAMEKRRADAMNTGNIDEHAKEVLRSNEQIRSAMADEIAELRARSERRKAERAEEEAKQAEQRAEEAARHKAMEEERGRKKEEELAKRREAQERMATFETLTRGAAEAAKEEPSKSKEQLEAEKKAIMAQRIQPLSVDGLGMSELKAKATELHNQIIKLTTEKYDMETRFKKGASDMVELSERAKQISKGGKGKAIRSDIEDVDKFQEKFGAPPKINLHSAFERQKDKRSYGEKHVVFEGPQFLYPPDPIPPQRTLVWGYEGPEYSGAAPPPRQPEPAPVPEPEPEPIAAE